MGAPTRGQRHDSARASVTGKAMTAARPAPTAPPGSFAWALGGALAALIALRFLAELRTDARFWGLDYARFLAPGLRFGPWVAALIAVLLESIPSVRSGVARGVGRIGGGHVLAALICGALCLACPDLILFTGDFALRRSAIAGLTRFDRLFPQATQLDRLVHLVVPQALRSWTGLSVETVASATGVIEAMIFGALSVEFARRCGARGVTVLMAVCVVAGSGAIGLFTGYDKSLAEMGIVTLAFGVAALGEIARGRAGWASGLLAVLGLAFHRSGLALLPAWIALWVMLRGGAPVPGPRGWPWARLVPSALLLALIPIALRTSSAVDARHLVPNGAGALLGEMVAPLRLLALLNLALFLVPLLPLLPVAYWASRPGRDPALRWLVTLAVCWLIPCFLIHPVQGEFRDWDDFAAAGVAAALPLAWLLIRSPARTAAPLAIALAGAAAVPRIQWLALQASPERALARIEAWATAPHPPLNTAVAAALEHVAMIHFKQGRLDDARRAMKASLAEARWVRVLLEWANAEAQQGDWTLAQSLYDQAARMRPDDPGVWVFMAQGAFRRGDRNAAIRAVTALKRIAPADPRIGQIEAAISALPVPP